MTQATLAYHWTQEEFLRAWEAGVFRHRVELVRRGIPQPPGVHAG